MKNGHTRYEVIVFDLDGTLLDTLDDLHASVCYALQNYGYSLRTREEVRAFVGNGVAKLMERALGGIPDDYASILQTFKDHYKAHCKDKTQPYQGIEKLLRTLKAQNKKIAVVSNKADFAVQTLCKDYFGAYIDGAVGENEDKGIRKKPAPDSVLCIMRSLGGNAQNTVYIGDSEVDIQTAQNAGVDCISVTWGFKDENFLRANGAQTLAHTAGELQKILLGE